MLIRELRRRGTRGSKYVYVLIGNQLVHISEVAKLVGNDEDEYVYELPDNISSWIYIFSFSRSGYSSILRCKPTYGINETIDTKHCENKSIENAINDWLNGIDFKIEDPVLRNLVNQLSEFKVMADEVKRYWSSIGGRLRFMGHASRLTEFFKDTRVYYFTELSIPDDIGRIRGIKTTMSLIYENWIAAKIAEALNTRTLVRRSWETISMFINEPVSVWFEQGGDTSFAILNTPYGEFTMWLEFQVDPAIHVFPNPELIEKDNEIRLLTEHKRRAVRPDIVIARGVFNGVKDLIESGSNIEALIECKAMPYDEWKKDIKEQIMPYIKQFKPRAVMLVTHDPIPNNAKKKLRNNGIEIFEDVKPQGQGTARFMDSVKRIVVRVQ